MPPYTGAETRILMSFAMKDGGHLFSQWLRNRLMKALDYFSTNSIYLDTVASREGATTHSTVMPDPKTHEAGKTYVAPDTRNTATEGFTTIGGMNKGWNDAYLKAMSEASVMLFIMSPEYLLSEWCIKEWNQFMDESKKRGSKNALYGLVILFTSGEQNQMAAKLINADNMDKITTPKIQTTGGDSTALKAGGTGWAISDSNVLAILEKIRPRLPRN